MKKFWLVSLVILAMVIPALAFSATETPAAAGTLQATGKVKWLYAYQAEDDNAIGYGGNAIENFLTTNVEVDIKGTVGEKVAYYIEITSMAGPNVGYDDISWWGSNPGEMGVVGIRQAKIMVSDLIPMTTVTLGTFNLPVSIYQPRATNDYDLIMLPLINQVNFNGSNHSGGGWGVYQPIGLGWQSSGVDFCIQPSENIGLDVAYFDGYASWNANGDIDLEKSWLINLKIKPSEPTMLSIAYLTEGWQEPRGNHTVSRDAAGWVVSGAFINDKVELNFDWMTMTAQDYMIDRSGDETNLTWTGYQITGGYWATDSLEVLLRYEWIDPNIENDSKLDKAAYLAGVNVNSNYDQLTWFTLGVNYRLNEMSEVSVNYIWRMEQGDDIKTPNRVPNPTVIPTGRAKYQVLDNDLFLIQVQVWQ